MCFIYDTDGYLVGDLTDKAVTARKAHRCADCGTLIKPGSRYHLLAFMWRADRETNFVTDRWCLACQALRSEVAKREEDRGCSGAEAWPPAGELWDALRSGEYEGVKGWFGFYRRLKVAKA